MVENTQFCTFYLGDLFFGVKVENVQEGFQVSGDDKGAAGAFGGSEG